MFWPNPSSTTASPSLVVHWLNQPGRSLAQLEAEYFITAKRHKLYTNLVQLKYSQIESDFNNPMVRECRGIILDENHDWEVVAWPFSKFGNYGESYVPAIDWASARIQEKLDGSLMILYHYNYAWQVATSGTPDASGEVNGMGWTFKDLFWDVWKSKGYQNPSVYEENLTFMFELMTPFNKIVVHHARPDLKLIGIRNRVTGMEVNVSSHVRWDRVREFDHTDSIETLKKTFDIIDPTKQEGYVVVDKYNQRVKVKHPGYVRLHHLRDSLTPRGIMKVIQAGEDAEVVASFPEWTDVFADLKAAFEGLAMELEQAWLQAKLLVPRKNFAEQAKKTRVPAILFLLLDGRIQTAKEGLMKFMQVDALMNLLDAEKLVARDLPAIVEEVS